VFSNNKAGTECILGSIGFCILRNVSIETVKSQVTVGNSRFDFIGILKDKPEVMFFEHLYKLYIERKENLSYLLSNSLREIVKFAEKNLQNIDPESISTLFEEFKTKANELLKEKQ
jgi:hypothetical protein